jgi:hypothetical protein
MSIDPLSDYGFGGALWQRAERADISIHFLCVLRIFAARL